MKNTTLFLILIVLISCNSNKESTQEKDAYPRKDRFIVSENDARLDSIINAPVTEEGIEKFVVENLPNEQSTATIHFLIEDNKKAYYIEKPYFQILCGTHNESDSILQMKHIEENKNYLDSMVFIDANSIPDFLNKIKGEIIKNEERNFPRTISFALKNDTLKGSLMHDILTKMYSTGMNSYFIRRMNPHELQAIQNFSKQ